VEENLPSRSREAELRFIRIETQRAASAPLPKNPPEEVARLAMDQHQFLQANRPDAIILYNYFYILYT
jgi:hypothetical protein